MPRRGRSCRNEYWSVRIAMRAAAYSLAASDLADAHRAHFPTVLIGNQIAEYLRPVLRLAAAPEALILSSSARVAAGSAQRLPSCTGASRRLPGAAGDGKTRRQAIGDVGGIHGARLCCAQPTVGLLSRPYLTFLGTGEGMRSRLALLMGLAQRRNWPQRRSLVRSLS